MARILPSEPGDRRSVVPFIGAHVLETLTAGMYDNPLVIYREYIQNSVDAIDLAVREGMLNPSEAQISIVLSGKDRTITIEDNGIGVPAAEASRVLGDIGNSTKNGTGLRGFRGIGRLGGIGYCQVLRFETRASSQEPVAVVEWEASRLHRMLASAPSQLSLTDLVKRVLTVTHRYPGNEPAHFFRVTLFDVRPFHDDVLIDPKMVKHYLSQVAPVPYDCGRFSFVPKVHDALQCNPSFREYSIRVNGQQLFRPYQDEIVLSKNIRDRIEDIEFFEFPDGNGGVLGTGWYAKTTLLGAIPLETGIPHIRVRQGNIQVGNERFLDRCFSEARFARWHVGELHILDGRLKPNARRDGFEPSPEYERFLEYSHLLGEHLSHVCRQASQARNAIKRAERELEELERLLSPQMIVSNAEQVAKRKHRSQELLEKIEHIMVKYPLPIDFKKRFERATQMQKHPYDTTTIARCLDGRTIRHKSKPELVEDLCRHILLSYSETRSADELISAIVEPYLKPNLKKRSSSTPPDPRFPGRRHGS